MAASSFRPLPKGIYTPLPTFFTATEELDLAAFASHVKFTAVAGTIPVVAGSAGEAAHLSPTERTTLIQTARRTLDSCGLNHVPIVAGVGALSTWETIQLAGLAKEAGADYGMVIPPGYYAGALQANGNEALRKFFIDVAKASPLPIVVYNFPGVSGGIDLDSDLIIDVIKASPNVVGVKLTCASVGKLTRINAIVSSKEFKEKYPRKDPEVGFRIIDGYIDILLPSIASGAAGAISGLPNLVPRTCARLWELASSIPGTVEYKEAQHLQNRIALADGFLQKIGFAGMKMLLHKRFGYSPLPRRPLLPSREELGDKWIGNPLLVDLIEEEERLASIS
ncbi:putative dihydrodipicolinate synthase [Hypomontagnella monticulosa]|nr:putative dihydrodipicolinate synthase [Hypomontagnella monticulosa]